VAWIVKKLVRWLLLLIAIPVTVWTAEKIAEQVEQRRGPSSVTRVLRAPGRWRRGEPLLAD
jgi:NADH:ubiquinone oxidoreductase subunit H